MREIIKIVVLTLTKKFQLHSLIPVFLLNAVQSSHNNKFERVYFNFVHG